MDKILILDFGSQVTQLIARRLRETNIYCEIHPFNYPVEKIKDFAPKGIIFSGGPSSITSHAAPRVTQEVFALNLPILGICYGQQMICELLGGKVESSNEREFGKAEVTVTKDSPLFGEAWKSNGRHQVWMSHGDRVVKLPEGFEVIATTPHAPFAAVQNLTKKKFAVQFHPEVAHTPDGIHLLRNFAVNICGCKADWNMHNFMELAIEKIRTQVGDKHVIAGVSGGVDSTVVAALLHQAIGNNLTCIFVDHGLLRKNEAKNVLDMFADFHIPLHYVDARETFLSRLSGITDPEQKRKIIGATFIDIFDAEAKKIKGAEFLAQGTLYPDVIESVSVYGDASVTIKSHHNVGGLPARMKLKLVEPVRELFKDEVRALGRELGIKSTMVDRHPFPGPGLAIRIPGEITEEKIRILQEADALYIQAIRDAGLYNTIWQAFAVLLPVKTVGVMGDERTYDYVCALRAVTSSDGMTADFYPFTAEFLGSIATKIINQVKGINRVVYDYTSKPPGTIEWE